MLQESTGAASPATVEVQLLASPTLACRQAWSKKGNSYLWQRAFPTLSKESVLPSHFCRVHANDLVLRNLAQPEAANGAKLFLLRYHVLGPNVHSDLCIHPTFHPPLLSSTGVHQSLHKFFRGLGGWERNPVYFLLQGSSSAAKLGAECSLMSLLGGITHRVPWHEKKRVLAGGIPSCPAPIPGLMSLVWFGLVVVLWKFFGWLV